MSPSPRRIKSCWATNTIPSQERTKPCAQHTTGSPSGHLGESGRSASPMLGGLLMFSDITTQRQTWRAVVSTAGMIAILLAPIVAAGREPAGREDRPMITKRAFLAGHTGDEGRNYVRCVAFSPDGKLLASGGED